MFKSSARRAVIMLMVFAVAVFAIHLAASVVAFAQGAAPPEALPVVPGGVATSLVLGSAASMPAGYLVGFFKHAYPEASGRSLIVVAVIGGLLSSLLMTMLAGGVQMTQSGIATLIMQGIGAGALSAGIGATNSSGDTKRTEVAASGG